MAVETNSRKEVFHPIGPRLALWRVLVTALTKRGLKLTQQSFLLIG
jgi:hypothetical protein